MAPEVKVDSGRRASAIPAPAPALETPKGQGIGNKSRIPSPYRRTPGTCERKPGAATSTPSILTQPNLNQKRMELTPQNSSSKLGISKSLVRPSPSPVQDDRDDVRGQRDKERDQGSSKRLSSPAPAPAPPPAAGSTVEPRLLKPAAVLKPLQCTSPVVPPCPLSKTPPRLAANAAKELPRSTSAARQPQAAQAETRSSILRRSISTSKVPGARTQPLQPEPPKTQPGAKARPIFQRPVSANPLNRSTVGLRDSSNGRRPTSAAVKPTPPGLKTITEARPRPTSSTLQKSATPPRTLKTAAGAADSGRSVPGLNLGRPQQAAPARPVPGLNLGAIKQQSVPEGARSAPSMAPGATKPPHSAEPARPVPALALGSLKQQAPVQVQAGPLKPVFSLNMAAVKQQQEADNLAEASAADLPTPPLEPCPSLAAEDSGRPVPKLDLGGILQKRLEEAASEPVFTAPSEPSPPPAQQAEKKKSATRQTSAKEDPAEHFYLYPKVTPQEKKKMEDICRALPRKQKDVVQGMFTKMVEARQNCEQMCFRGHRLLDQAQAEFKNRLAQKEEEAEQWRQEVEILRSQLAMVVGGPRQADDATTSEMQDASAEEELRKSLVCTLDRLALMGPGSRPSLGGGEDDAQADEE
ncbi:hypothetical protein HYH03_001010 [Edaphochlamys debaryana]|uniref:Uncharacterized protein n=1 Tax=Edaphochlamys debaryana TaxID=47281 RepID=A0A835YEQ6_9CHLO|nr:hypothetical protein HYH03_001010 [Edaphochlamys debaryana]|eukprot:KAG2501196.1 hypothetical protein HYH03_001010 [Edaphochlamys debaryana]